MPGHDFLAIDSCVVTPQGFHAMIASDAAALIVAAPPLDEH